MADALAQYKDYGDGLWGYTYDKEKDTAANIVLLVGIYKRRMRADEDIQRNR